MGLQNLKLNTPYKTSKKERKWKREEMVDEITWFLRVIEFEVWKASFVCEMKRNLAVAFVLFCFDFYNRYVSYQLYLVGWGIVCLFFV